MDDETRADIFRQMIRHEDTLRDDRLGYLLTLNGLLFAALAFAWRTNDAESVPLVLLLAIVGTLVGVSAHAAQLTSNAAVTTLRLKAQTADDPPVIGLTGDETTSDADLPPSNGENLLVSKTNQALVPWVFLPKLLIVIWPLIALVRLAIGLIQLVVRLAT